METAFWKLPTHFIWLIYLPFIYKLLFDFQEPSFFHLALSVYRSIFGEKSPGLGIWKTPDPHRTLDKLVTWPLRAPLAL